METPFHPPTGHCRGAPLQFPLALTAFYNPAAAKDGRPPFPSLPTSPSRAIRPALALGVAEGSCALLGSGCPRSATSELCKVLQAPCPTPPPGARSTVTHRERSGELSRSSYSTVNTSAERGPEAERSARLCSGSGPSPEHGRHLCHQRDFRLRSHAAAPKRVPRCCLPTPQPLRLGFVLLGGDPALLPWAVLGLTLPS